MVQSAPHRQNEEECLAALRALDVLDSAAEAEFDALVRVASAVCGVPVSLISLIDAERQWFQANIGLPGVTETPRDRAFCAHVVLGDKIVEVPDATQDPRFADNPLVTGPPGIRFYAGAPVSLSGGVRIGSLCVIDHRPRRLDEAQRQTLHELAVIAARMLEGRTAMRRVERTTRLLAASESNLRVVVDNMPSMIAYWNADLSCRFANRAFAHAVAKDPQELIGSNLAALLGEERFAHDKANVEAVLRGEPQTFERAAGAGDHAEPHRRHRVVDFIPDIVDGQVMGFLTQVNYVNALKETEYALREEIAARERAHAELRESAAALKEAQRLGQIGSWEWPIGASTATWSEELYRIMGHDPARAPPGFEALATVYSNDSALRLQAALEQTQATGEPHCLELEFRRPDGLRGWVEGIGEAVRDERGTVTRLRGTAQDITRRKHAESELRKTQDFLERTGAMAGVGGWELEVDSGTVVWSNEVCRIHGVELGFRPTLAQAIDFYTPGSRPVIHAAVENALAGGTPNFDLELEIVRRDGQMRDVRTKGSVDFQGGRPVRLSGALKDVTERRQLASALAQEHELLRVTLQSIGDAVITTDAAGKVTWLNPVAERLTGWPADEATGQPLDQVFRAVHEETRAVAGNPVAPCLEHGRTEAVRDRALLISRAGQEFCIEDSASPIRSEAGQLLGAVLVFHDVSEQRRLSGEMTYRATHDALTGLVNRAEFEARLLRVLQKAHEERSEHAMLYIDLDQFKLVNDSCGHSVGDQLLRQVGQLLGDAVRASDTLARLGGDEFGIILEYCNAEQAQRVAQKICDRMDDFRFTHEAQRFRIGASIGLVPVDQRWRGTAAIQQAADTSCYAAKEAGRNRVHAWFDTDTAMRNRQFEMQWTTRIERALDDDGFALFAQRLEPLKGPSHGLHAEVLLRMKNDDGSFAPPGAFLPAAERFHLASRVDRWVLRHSVAWMKALRSLDLIESLSVNLSGQSVGDRAFHEWAHETLAGAGPEVCSKLCFEITETAAVTSLADAAVFIDKVRANGVKVALDDFGAGASSFGYLKSLKVDYLKIDGQFIRDLVTDPLDDAAVRCFADVARVVGVKTVAEFVDQPAVLARLREIGVDYAQGYLIHRPEPIDGLIATTGVVGQAGLAVA